MTEDHFNAVVREIALKFLWLSLGELQDCALHAVALAAVREVCCCSGGNRAGEESSEAALFPPAVHAGL